MVKQAKTCTIAVNNTLTKFNVKKKPEKNPLSIKKLCTSHEGVPANKTFAELFQIETLKACKKPFTRNAKEGTNIAAHTGEISNKKKLGQRPKPSAGTRSRPM